MRKLQLIFTVVLVLSFSFSKAQDLKGFSKEKTMTFFGVDYSNTLFVGRDGFQDVEKVATYYPNTWNILFQKEFKKYSLKKYLYKDDVFNSLKIVDSINSKITKKDLELRLGNSFDSSKLLTLEKAKQIALNYKLDSSKTKYGAIVFATEYNKMKNIGSYILVVLDLQSNTVVYAKGFKGKAKGFGFRNFWAGSYYSALKSLKKAYRKDIKSL